MSVPVKPCWICGAPATTGEHKTKRSDLHDVYGRPSQAQPLYIHDYKMRNRRVGSLKSDYLKSPARLCEPCNSTRTQPHDMAWETMSAALRSRVPPITPGAIIQADRVFPKNTALPMRHVHLYFVKQCGMCFIEGELQVDIGAFGQAILRGKAHPRIYLKFGVAPPLGDEPRTGRTGIAPWSSSRTGECALAYWDYYIGGVGVRVIYAIEDEPWRVLKGAWHPRMGVGKLEIADLAIDAPRP